MATAFPGHDDIIKWKHFPPYWHFVLWIHRSPGNSPHKGHRRGALMFSSIGAWKSGWINNREASDLRRHRAHYHVTAMNPQPFMKLEFHCRIALIKYHTMTRHRRSFNRFTPILIRWWWLVCARLNQVESQHQRFPQWMIPPFFYIIGNCVEIFAIITKQSIHTVEGSALKIASGMTKNGKMGYWVIMLIFNELWCWFSIASADMHHYNLCPKMKWLQKICFWLSRELMTERRRHAYKNNEFGTFFRRKNDTLQNKHIIR